ncbi:hypothetical protein Nekkels1_4 [Cellulophaga phage Nekkels_1]|uniref:Uncharacterized protein n=1 Tax=Cellulophaga phage Nekkels_1 TaxID=2745692 RepID=A0A8E4UXH2_9CAUD|nr:hypothetical protein M1M31_gp04 [Cellulophaga phage Nekkels_1]QQO97041.1 hypothetical protein Nekkels1_4 [Cellulophaga phage Nekkels_1]QQO97134.1 hypothetical protein Nekkels2_4 [Cellulophaga phage Nekkels_2]
MNTKRNEDLKTIADIVSRVSGFNVRNNTRKREYVLSRCIYFRISKDVLKFNTTLDAIGSQVNLNFSTVLHSLSNFDVDVKLNKSWYKIYIDCLRTCIKVLSINDLALNKTVLVHGLINQRCEINDFKTEIERLKKSKIEKQHPFIQELNKLTPQQLFLLKERSGVMIKSVKNIKLQ